MIKGIEQHQIHEFHFQGGCRDGVVVRSNALNSAERDEALRLIQDFGAAHVGVTRPVFTPEVMELLLAGKQKDLARLKEHYQLYQVVSHETKHGIAIVRCVQLVDDDR